MNIDFDGIHENCQGELSRAALFFSHELLGKRRSRSINLTISLLPGRQFHGLCVCDDIGRNPKNFEICIRRMSMTGAVKTLAHEMVHLRQYATNDLVEMTQDAQGTALWKNVAHTVKDYFSSPWEVEAYGMEPGLYHSYLSKFRPALVGKKLLPE